MRLGPCANFRTSIIAAAAALCLFTAGCSLTLASPASHALFVTDSDNGKTIVLAPGASLVVSLGAVSGTGYSWRITGNDPSVLAQRGLGNFELAKSAMPGAMGKQVFHFVAKARGMSLLEMAYLRPWEKNVAPAKTWSITVQVED
ncbi:MAG: protease inhibitor I42 family protein [Candidatus Binataceae bacterium]